MANSKLLKRLDHNIGRIKDPTILQLLKDAKEELLNSSPQSERPLATEVTVVPEGDRNALSEMMDMTVLMERAGFIGIMETYKSQKHKLPNCVTANRVGGTITAFVVHFGGPDETAVTLRNPECVEPEQVVPTSVTASVTHQQDS